MEKILDVCFGIAVYLVLIVDSIIK